MGSSPDEIAHELAAWLERPDSIAAVHGLLLRLLPLYAEREEELERAERLLEALLRVLARKRSGLDALARALEPHLEAFARDEGNHTRVVRLLEAIVPAYAASGQNSQRVAALLREIVPVYFGREANHRIFAPVVAELLPRYGLRRSEQVRFAPILLDLLRDYAGHEENAAFVADAVEVLLPPFAARPENAARLRASILPQALALLEDQAVRAEHAAELETLCGHFAREFGMGERVMDSFASLTAELVEWHARRKGERARFAELLAGIMADYAREESQDAALAPLAEAVLRGYCAREANEEHVAGLLTDLLPRFARWEWGVDTPLRRHLAEWQRAGFSLLPTHHYSPVPNVNELSEALETESELVGIDMHVERQLEFLRKVCPAFREEYARWPEGPSGRARGFHFGNGTFECVDAELLHCVLRDRKPRRMIEVGSGWSTLVASEACLLNWEEDGVECDFRAIEPHPNEILERPLPGLKELVREPLQAVDRALFEALGAGDVLFIDSTHVLRMGSDVALLYLEILPRLAPGVLVHIHDIFMPAEYPARWVLDEHVFWNEQYLVQAFLAFNSAFEVWLAASFLHHRHPEAIAEAFPRYAPQQTTPGSLWIRRAS